MFARVSKRRSKDGRRRNACFRGDAAESARIFLGPQGLRNLRRGESRLLAVGSRGSEMGLPGRVGTHLAASPIR
jgi:hypothetical protein